MVRNAPRALAGTAASAARKVIGRRSRGATEDTATEDTAAEPAPTKPAKKTPAKKPPAKKPPAEKAASKTTTKAPAKTAAEKTPTRSKATTTKVTTAKKTPTKTAAKPTVKKAAAKKVPASREALLASLVVKEGETPWTKAELQAVIDELHEQRTHSLVLLEKAETDLDGLMRDSGDGAGQDQADVGATTFERDHELTVVNSERDKLAQIDRALSHTEDGTYGVCESCGEPIGKLRAMAFPRATLCMTCKQREERR